MKKVSRNLPVKLLSLFMGLVFILVLSPRAFAASTASPKTVKVGFFEFDGYHHEDENGVRSGYGYEFLQKVATYNEWVYEYVGYDKSWSEMQTMLENGEIDLLTSAQKTPERMEKFDFSQNPIGTSATILTVKAGDMRYLAGDYSSYNNMRVGMIKGNSRNDSFDAFAKEHDFSYSAVYYSSTDELASALQDGEKIDAIVTSNLRSIKDEWILEQFDASPFYAMVRKGDSELLEELDYAINSMDNYSPGWRTELFKAYYQPDDGGEISFSAEERAYLADAKASGTVFKAVVNPDRKPYSYFEDGQAKGIMVEAFKLIAQRAGIQYSIIETADRGEYNEMIESGQADIIIDSYNFYYKAEKNGYKLSDPYLTNSISRITRKDFDGSLDKVAALERADIMLAYHDALFAKNDTKYYDSLAQCVSAVENKRSDCTYAYAYTAQLVIHEDVRNRLTATVLPEYKSDFCVAVSNKIDHRLLGVLNKAVGTLKEAEIEEIVQQQTSFQENAFSIVGLLYDQPLLVAIVLMLALAIAFLVCIQIVRSKNANKLKVQAQELERFVGYVCSTNDMVLEVNLDTMQSLHYYYKDGRVESCREPYCFAEYQNHDDRIDADDFSDIIKDITKEKMLQAIENGEESFYFEARVQDAAGEKKWFAYTLKAIPRDLLHPNNFIIFKNNINDTKQAEENQRRALTDALENARNASMAKGQFLSRMSHEIRTPLNAVIGYMDIAKGAKDNPEKMLHCIENSGLAARHLLNIINDVLDISSIESGRMKIAQEEFDLKKQITTVSTLFFNQAKAKRVLFNVLIHGLTEEWVIGDSLRVNQILMNLLSNAVKFTPENGKITLTVTQMNLTDEHVFMKFEVSDTGIGMSEEYRNRLFQPFEQENASIAQKYGGTGLGLSITKNLISMMQGSIEVRSKQGEGTTFVVSIRFAKAKQHYAETPLQDYSHVRVLVVDDEKSSCDYIKTMLKRCGVKSDTVISGDDAIRQIKRRLGTDYAYDLCIMDWNMPEMDGVETTRRIRQECDANIPIIIATAYDITEFEDEAKVLGVTKVISKPLFQSTMFDLLVSTFGKYTPVPLTRKTAAAHLKGLRVLLAEDNEMNQEIAVDVLTKSEIEVNAVSDGQQAVDAFLKAPQGTYHAILMDIQMPVLNGYQAARKIRESAHPEAKSIPIIAMTANAFDEDIAAAIASGMNDHISKPVDYDKLFTVLEKIMRQKENKE